MAQAQRRYLLEREEIKNEKRIKARVLIPVPMMTHEEVQKQQHLPSKIQHYVPEPDSPVTPVPK